MLERDKQDEVKGEQSTASCEAKVGLNAWIQETMISGQVEEEDRGDKMSHPMS